MRQSYNFAQTFNNKLTNIVNNQTSLNEQVKQTCLWENLFKRALSCLLIICQRIPISFLILPMSFIAQYISTINNHEMMQPRKKLNFYHSMHLIPIRSCMRYTLIAHNKHVHQTHANRPAVLIAAALFSTAIKGKIRETASKKRFTNQPV